MRLILKEGIRVQLLKADTSEILDELAKDIDKCTENGTLKDVPEHAKRRWNAATERRRIELNKRKEKK